MCRSQRATWRWWTDLWLDDLCLLIITIRLIECTYCRGVEIWHKMNVERQMSTLGVEKLCMHSTILSRASSCFFPFVHFSSCFINFRFGSWFFFVIFYEIWGWSYFVGDVFLALEFWRQDSVYWWNNDSKFACSIFLPCYLKSLWWQSTYCIGFI